MQLQASIFPKLESWSQWEITEFALSMGQWSGGGGKKPWLQVKCSNDAGQEHSTY